MINHSTIFILCGGFGTRLRSEIGGTAKSLSNIENKVFLDIQMDWLCEAGFKNFVFLTGFKSSSIKDHLYQTYNNSKIQIRVVNEKIPLGTGGAVKNALNKLKFSSDFFVVNGDTIAEIKFDKFSEFCNLHSTHSIYCLFKKNAGEYGSIEFDKNSNIIKFNEKQNLEKNIWVNSGLYFFPKEHNKYFKKFPNEFSLEKYFFPKLIEDKINLKAFSSIGSFIDIGTPSRLNKFRKDKEFWKMKS